ncbi:MAG: hypothetical protein R6W88_10760 [Desulfobacterales bacterium]
MQTCHREQAKSLVEKDDPLTAALPKPPQAHAIYCRARPKIGAYSYCRIPHLDGSKLKSAVYLLYRAYRRQRQA